MKIPTFLNKYKTLILLSLILLTSFSLRSYGRNWDEGGHMHPDERMLIMVADRISFPSQLNPDFFNYGSLPVYLLKGTAQMLDVLLRPSLPFAGYNGMLTLGRFLSSFADVGTVLLIFFIAYRLSHKRTVGLLAALLYSIAFFPIQNSHFFVVDVFVTFFITALVASLVWHAQMRHPLAVVVMGLSMGAAVATKFTALVFMPGIIISLGIIHYCSSPRKQSRELVTHILVFVLTSLVFFAFSMPFAFLPPSGILTPRDQKTEIQAAPSLSSALEQFPGVFDIANFLNPNHVPYTRFLRDIREQTRMNSDAYVFPYTLQYVTTKPYVYHIEQILKWGLGPFIGILTVIGAIFMMRLLALRMSLRGVRSCHPEPVEGRATQQSHFLRPGSLVIVSCLCIVFGLYFLIIGRSAVKFMRYMLPLYPIFALLAGVGLAELLHTISTNSRPIYVLIPYKALTALLVVGALLWTVAFVNIYSQRNTRIRATEWILSHIPQGKTLAVEHWDDRVPIRNGEQYNYQEMTIYELPDNEKKWESLSNKLAQSDYVVLASNRLYIPLPKLADCTKFKVCYPLTAKYYQQLFDGSLGFKKLKEFTAYPRIGPWQIVDDNADESFTVYDHPKILIYGK